MPNRKKIIIFGGGIGGLSSAHELSKYPLEFNITLIERNNFLGGQAAEYTTKTNNNTAMCWHAVSNNYKYFLDIMDEITYKGIKVISHLRPIDRFIYAFEQLNYVELENAFITTNITNMIDAFEKIYKKKISYKDKYKLFSIYIYALSICEERLEEFDGILWKDYIGEISPNIKRWLVDSTSIFLGMEYNKISVHFMFHIMRSNEQNTQLNKKTVFYSFDQSMYKVLYKPWKLYLEARGVKILLNTNIEKIYYIADFSTISTIDTSSDNKTYTYSADIFINSMGGDSMSLLHPTQAVRDNFKELYKLSRQIQTQVLYYLPYKLQHNNTSPTVLIIPDSMWFLMVKIEGDIWDLTCNDLLSCGIGIWDTPGLNGKKAIECTRLELAVECWNQIHASQHNLKLNNALPEWNIWESFKFNEEIFELDTFEPKFSNNINTLKYRPDFRDSSIANLYHGNATAKTLTNIYNMESAAEAGVKVARIIIADMLRLPNPIYKIKVKKYILFIRYFDKMLFKIKKIFKKIIGNLF